MFESARLLYLYVESPLHAGSGRGLGAVDLPIQRERVTGYPLVQASGLKGALRSECEKRSHDKDSTKCVFGPETDKASDYAGAISPGDARLLLFPVRSLAGVFAWTTSLDALSRFQREAIAAGEKLSWSVPAVSDDEKKKKNVAWVCDGTPVIAGGKVVLEEFAFSQDTSRSKFVADVALWLADNALPDIKKQKEYEPWRDKLLTNLVILPDDAFRDFTQFATEIITRVKLNPDTKTVDKAVGGLWTEEHLPVDTLLYAPLLAVSPRCPKKDVRALTEDTSPTKAVMKWVAKWLDGKRIQLGGDETVGRGTVVLRFGPVHSLNGKEGGNG